MTGFFIGLIAGLVLGFCIVMFFHDYDPKTDRLTWRKRS